MLLKIVCSSVFRIMLVAIFLSTPSYGDEFPKHPSYKQAIKLANKSMVGRALSGDIHINDRDSKGATALVHAATLGDRSAVNKLIRLGADLNIRKHNGSTALIAAAQTGHDDIVQDLIDAGADMEALALNDSVNALMKTIVFDYPKTLIVLLESGATPNPQLPMSPLYVAVIKNKIDIVDILIRYKVDIDSSSFNNKKVGAVYPVLYAAVSKGHLEIVKLLLEGGANPNLASSKGISPLWNAVRKSQYEISGLLLKAGADPNIRNKGPIMNGFTPLYSSIFRNDSDLKMATMLLDAGADPNITMKNGLTTLSLAVSIPEHSRIKLLHKYGVDLDATFSNNSDAKSFSEKLKSVKNWSVFFTASVERTFPNKSRSATPLIAAAVVNDLATADLLLRLGADVNATDSFTGNTALHLSPAYPQVTRLLLENGAVWDKKNNSGYTARNIHEEFALDLEAKRLEEARLSAEENSSFNWAKALTMGVGLLAGGGARLPPDTQADTILGIIRDSQAGVSGISNTTGALNSAAQRYRQENINKQNIKREASKYIQPRANGHNSNTVSNAESSDNNGSALIKSQPVDLYNKPVNRSQLNPTQNIKNSNSGKYTSATNIPAAQPQSLVSECEIKLGSLIQQCISKCNSIKDRYEVAGCKNRCAGKFVDMCNDPNRDRSYSPRAIAE